MPIRPENESPVLHTCHVLVEAGDLTIQWDPTKPEEVAEAERAVANLKAQGYTFFLIDGSPVPDRLPAGMGALSCRRIEAEEVVVPRRPRGRPRKTEARPAATAAEGRPEGDEAAEETVPEEDVPVEAPRRVVATRPLRGG